MLNQELSYCCHSSQEFFIISDYCRNAGQKFSGMHLHPPDDFLVDTEVSKTNLHFLMGYKCVNQLQSFSIYERSLTKRMGHPI